MAKSRFTEQSIPVRPVVSTEAEVEDVSETVQESVAPPVVKRKASEKPRRLAARVGQIIALLVIASGVSSYLVSQNEKDPYIGSSGANYRDMFSKDTALYSLANIRFKMGDLKGSGNIVQEIESGNAVDPRRRSELLKKIIDKYVEKKEYYSAFDLSYKCMESGDQFENLSYLPEYILGHAIMNDENIYSLLKNSPDQAKTAILFAILYNNEEKTNSDLLKNKYMEILRELKKSEERNQWRMRKISSLFSEKKVKEAKEIFNSLEKTENIDHYIMNYVSELSENGLISEALEETKKIEKSKRIPCLGAIGRSCIELGKIEEAKKIFLMIRSILPEPEKYIPEDYGDRTTYHFLLFDIIKAESKLGNKNSVRRFLQMITDKNRWEEFRRRNPIVLAE